MIAKVSLRSLLLIELCAVPASSLHAQVNDPQVANSEQRLEPVKMPIPNEEEIVVTGNREGPNAAIDRFVDALLAETHNGKVARWANRICLNIEGASPAQKQYFDSKIGEVASWMGIEVLARRDCEPSTYIIFTKEPDLFLEKLSESRPAFLGAISRAQRNEFRGSDAPVRWISRSELRGAQGETPSSFKLDPASGGKEDTVPSTKTSPSRLMNGSRMDLQAMLILVDASKVSGISYRSLSAYLAMVVFGNLRPNYGSLKRTSILNIFRPDGSDRGAISPDLSDWDLAYLKSLYQGTWNVASEQRSQQIKASMARNLQSQALDEGRSR